MAIKSFGDKTTETFYFYGTIPRTSRWKSVAKIAARKLDMIAYSTQLQDLKSPPNNRLEKLKGNFANFFSIRINDQWRIIFKWTEHGPSEVKIVDYH